jgi:hypothetical protein
MKPSLEDERRALLEQIEASRAVYRRMLSDEPETGSRTLRRGAAAGERALHWVTGHPLWVAGAVALLVLLAPRMIKRRRRTAHESAVRHHYEPDPRRSGTQRAWLTAAALLLRDPTSLRAVTRFARSAWQWIQRRRIGAASSRTPSLH